MAKIGRVGGLMSVKTLCCVFLLSYFSATAQPVSVRAVLADSSKKVLVAAHRGDWKNYPENSIPAIVSCIDKGIDIVEIDVQRTSDGHFVLMHDQTLRRTTNGKGRVSKCSRATITKLFLRDKDGKLTKHHVPVLDTVLKLTRGKIIVNIDKSSGHFPELLKLIDKYHCGGNVILKGSSPPSYFRDVSASDKTGTTFMPIINGSHSNVDSFLMVSNSSLLEVLLRTDTARLCQSGSLRRIRERGCAIWYNALFASIAGDHVENDDAIASWNWFIRHDARVIQTDYPFELMQHLIDEGLHPLPPGFMPVSLSRLPKKVVSNDVEVVDTAGQRSAAVLVVAVKDSTVVRNPTIRQPEAMNGRQAFEEKKYYAVKKNDTLSEIAERHHISLKKLLSLNPKLKKESILQIGQKIRVK